ncbi:MAG: hypothetical protein RLZZ350_846 [Verrucomicrobiota bacterium]
MKILFLSNLFPDAARPNRGIFNARLVHHLAAQCEMRVLSPRPTSIFSSADEFFPRAEDKKFLPQFPAAPYIPKVGSRWNHKLMARALRDPLQKLRAEFPFDAVLAAWLYPDACAVARLAHELDFPFVAVAQGSDAHQYLQIPTRKKIIAASLAHANSVVTRSAELARLLREAGVPAAKLHTIYSGVEQHIFQPADKIAVRQHLGFAPDETVLLYVGNFLSVKNPLLLVDAFAALRQREPARNFRLVMLGDGPLQTEILQRAEAAGLRARVKLPGRKKPAEVAQFMQAADLLCVPSDNEGVPNVIYEAFSCGLRAVTTRVGGIPEILTADFLGSLAPRGDAESFAAAVSKTISSPPEVQKILRHAAQFTWPRTAEDHRRLLAAAVTRLL